MTPRHRMSWIWPGLLVGVCLGDRLIAQEATKAEDVTERLRAECRHDTTSYEVTTTGAPTMTLKPVEIFQWGNAIRSGQLGVVHGWVGEGRLLAVSTVFTSRVDQRYVISHEWVSLAPEGLQAEFGGSTYWNPPARDDRSRPWEPLTVPAETRVTRLRQMRSLMSELSGYSLSSYGEQTRWELRLLPQPLYRQAEETPAGGPLDAALFAFVSSAGTDPELFVQLEARRVEGREPRWFWSAGRFSDHSLFLQRDGETIWSFKNEQRDVAFRAGLRDDYRWLQNRTLPLDDKEAMK